MNTKGRRAADRRRERQGKGPVDDGSGTTPGAAGAAVDPLSSDDDYDDSEPDDKDLPLVSQVREIEPEPPPQAGTAPNRPPKAGVARPGSSMENDAEASFVKAVRQSSEQRQKKIGEATAVRAPPDRPPRRGGHLIVLEGPDAGGETDIDVTPSLIGRSRTAEVGLTDPTISLRHIEIRLIDEDEGFALVDLGSTSGTLVNGRVVADETRLRHGDVIAIGKTELRFLRGEKIPAERQAPEPAPGDAQQQQQQQQPGEAPQQEPTEQLPQRERTKAGTQISKLKTKQQAPVPGPDPAVVRAKVRRTTTRVIAACVAILALAATAKVVHDRFFTDKAPAQVRAQVAELLAEGRNRLRAQDVDGARERALTVLALDEKNEDAQSLLRMADTEAEARDAIALALRLGDEERDVEAGQILKRVADASVFAPTRDRLRRTLDERGVIRSRRTIERLLDTGQLAEAAAAAEKHLVSWPNDDDARALLDRVKKAQLVVPKNPGLAAARAAFAAGDIARARSIAQDSRLNGYLRDLDDFTSSLEKGRAALKRFDDDAAESLDRAFRLLSDLGGDANAPAFADVRKPYANALYLAGVEKLDTSPCAGARDLYRAARVAGAGDAKITQKLRELDERALAGLDRARAARVSDPERASAVAREHLCLARTGSKTYDELRALSRL